MKMKKFLSALTAFCMGASMVASTLPASALTPVVQQTPTAQAGEHTWDIGDAVANDEGIAYVDIFVENDPGTSAYRFNVLIEVDGKWMTLPEAGAVIGAVEQGAAYKKMTMFSYNEENGLVTAANGVDTTPEVAVEGEAVVTYGLLVDGMADGVYNLKFDDTLIAKDNETEIYPTFTQGTLTIGDVVPTEGTTTSESETTETTKQTTASSDVQEPDAGVDGHTWDIGDAVAEDGIAYVDIFVTNDPGTSAYRFNVLIEVDGKWMTLPEAGAVIGAVEQGAAYKKMTMFSYNEENGLVTAANGVDTTPEVAVEGEAVVTYGLLVDGMADGVYNLKFDDTLIAKDNETEIYPNFTQGTLTIGEVETTESTDATESTESTPASDTDHTWDIGDAVAEDGIAYVDIFVTNDPGTSAYRFNVLIEVDGKWMTLPEAGAVIGAVEQGAAYKKMTMFSYNEENGLVTAANGVDTTPEVAVEGEAVVTYGLLVDGMADGVYNLKFDDTLIAKDNETEIYPNFTQGTLTIGEVETTESTDATESTESTPASDTDHTWDIGDAVAEDGVAYVDVFVTNDPGTSAYRFNVLIEVDGKWMTLPEAGAVIGAVEQGAAYKKMTMFSYNEENGLVTAANGVDTTPEVAVEGEAVVTYGLIVENIPDGVYNLKFDDTLIAKDNETEIYPNFTMGTLTIGAVETTESTEATEATEETVYTAVSSEIDAEWIIGTVEAQPGETVTVPVTVKGDVDGINSYIADLGQDAGPVAQAATKGDAYASLEFLSNMDNLTFGATNNSLDENVKAADNAVVFEITFEVPADAAGKYNITFEDLLIYNIDMVQLIPKQTNGWINVAVPTETTESVDDTEFVPSSSEIDAEWIIGTVEAEPGQTVTVPVTVKGDKDGINSYIADLGQDAGPTAKEGTAGDAYASLGFYANLDNLKFGATNNSVDSNIVAADNSVVFNVTFDVPADAAPGTVYNITFEDLEIYNIEMVQLIPKQTNGWIKIAEDDEFVEESSVIDAEWIIGTVEADPGETVTVPVTVKGDKDGINSYILDMGQDAGPVAGEATAGDAYSALSFLANMDALTFGATNNSLAENVVAADGAVVFNVTFTVPTDAEPGTVYNLVFEDLLLYNIEMVRLIPTQTDGWIKVREVESTTTTEATTNDPGEWIIGTAEVEAGATVTIPVTVRGDKNGINSYILDMGQDEGPVAQEAAAGDAYAPLTFYSKLDTLTFGATNNSVAENIFAEDDAVVMTVTFKVPDDAAPGTIYNLTFEELTIHDINMSTLVPVQTPGWIKIKDVETTTTTEATTTTTSEETTTETTTTTIGEAGMWIIGTTEVEAGATVTIPVTVKGDKNGINSYIFDMGQDAGPVAQEAAAGDAYAALNFLANIDTLTFGATNNSLAENVVAADDAVVLNVTFQVPADAEPGTIYNLTFEGLTVYDINMNELNPEQVAGWIKIKDVETTTSTEETTTSTEETTTSESETETTVTTTTESETETTVTTTTTESVTTTTEANTTETTATTTIGEAGMWIIGTTEVEAGATVTIPVTVKGDKNGINSYIFDMGQDAGPVAQAAEAGDAYAALNFLANIDTLTFGATNNSLAENVVAADGAVVLNVTFQVPADAEPGTIYNLTFEDLTVYDINMNELNPEQVAGWIKIKDVETTTSTEETTTSTEATTTTTETETTVTTTTESETETTVTTTTESETETTVTTTTESETETTVTTTTESETETTATTTTESETETTVTTTTESETETSTTTTSESETETSTTTTESETETSTTTTSESETETTVTTTTESESETSITTTESSATDSDVNETTESVATLPTDTESTATSTSTTETTTTTESVPATGAATWQIGTVEAKPGQKVTVNVTVYGDTGLNSYQFKVNQDAGPVANSATAGNAYPTLGFEYALDTLTFGGTSTNSGNVVAADGAVVVGITFTVPEDAQEGTIYNLTFDGDVEAINADMGTLNITEVPGWIKVLPADVSITGYEYEVVGQSQFYLSHDMRPFDPADLVTSVVQYTLYSDGTKSEGVEVNVANVAFDIPGWTNPEEVFNAQVLDAEGNPKTDYDVYYKGAIPATITDPIGEVHTLSAVGTAYIAVKGDATLTGEADAKDAAIVLMYAAKIGAGTEAYIYSETDAELEAFAYFLTDVTGESEDNGATDSLGNAGSDCDAKDAAKILVYAAVEGSGKYADWAEILSEPLPKYTAAIAAYKAANA